LTYQVAHPSHYFNVKLSRASLNATSPPLNSTCGSKTVYELVSKIPIHTESFNDVDIISENIKHAYLSQWIQTGEKKRLNVARKRNG